MIMLTEVEDDEDTKRRHEKVVGGDRDDGASKAGLPSQFPEEELMRPQQRSFEKAPEREPTTSLIECV